MPVAIFDGHLRLAVGPEIRKLAAATHVRQLFGKIMSKLNRQRHQFGRLVAGVAKHQSLIAGTAGVYALGDVGRLSTNGVDDAAGVRIVSETRVVVTDLLNGIANDLL